MEEKATRVEEWTRRLESERSAGGTWAEMIRRTSESPVLPEALRAETAAVRDEVLYRVMYRGYLDRELRQIEKLSHAERIRVPEGLNYAAIPGLRRESALKLAEIRPATLGQAGRISGVNPADISILMVYIAAEHRRNHSPE